MRYLPLTPADRSDMLAAVGAKSVDELFNDVPASARLPGKVAGLPDHLGELEVERAFQAYAAKNVSPSSAPFFIGAGAYRHHVPSAATISAPISPGGRIAPSDRISVTTTTSNAPASRQICASAE